MLIAAACSVTSGCGPADEQLTVLTYNVQNLFDGADSSVEYAEFRTASGWSQDKYYERLTRLSRVLRDLVPVRPDVIVLQEVENTGIIRDLVRDFLRFRVQVVAAPFADGPTRVVIVSRMHVATARVHQSVSVVVPSGASAGPLPSGPAPVYRWKSRGVVDVVVATALGDVRILGCHWKSQSGGERVTEAQRLQSAALVKDVIRAARPIVPLLVIGDLNEDLEEYASTGCAYATALMPVREVDVGAAGLRSADPRSLLITDSAGLAGFREGEPVLFSPWFTAESPGSYLYRGSWERLDHALLLPGAAALSASLRVIADPELLTARGEPKRYNPRMGSGYSDHLPVLVTLRAPQ